MRLIDADALYEKTAEWEAQALCVIEKTMNDEDKSEWRKWSVVLTERLAFKHVIADAPSVDVTSIEDSARMRGFEEGYLQGVKDGRNDKRNDK